MKKHDIDFCAHGEDVTILADGRDSFHEVKEAGMFKLIKRTDGVSTTDLLGLWILSPFFFSFLVIDSDHLFVRSYAFSLKRPTIPAHTHPSNFLASTRKIVQFASRRAIKPGYKVRKTLFLQPFLQPPPLPLPPSPLPPPFSLLFRCVFSPISPTTFFFCRLSTLLVLLI